MIKINGMDFTNIEHRAAVDTIRKAGNRIAFTVERRASPEAGKTNYSGPPVIEEPIMRTSAYLCGSETVPLVNGSSFQPNSQHDATSYPPSSPSPHLVFPCPKPYKGISTHSPSPTPTPTPSFDSMIPSEVKNPSAVVTVTIKQPDTLTPRVPDIFPPAPTDLGTVTEVITKSTLTETVFTRVTHNEPVMAPVLTEV